MAEPCPELVFVSGPQEGERAVLIKAVMVMGRSETCDIHLAEESTSREHLRFEMTADGCQMEILSTRGVRVNGKSFGPPKKIILDTGDCIFLGAATNVLFVSGGDDPEQALSAYRQAHGEALSALKAKKPVPAPAPAPPPKAAAPTPKKEETAPKPAEAASPSAEEQARLEVASKSRRRKFMILGGVYAVALVGLLFFLNGIKKTAVAAAGPPSLLVDTEITDALREALARGVNETIAAEELRNAQTAFDNRNFRSGNLQKCVKGFKLNLAYLNRREFDDAESTRMFQTASEELIVEVKKVYHEAWLREKGRQWGDAGREWDRLSAILPHDTEWNSPGYGKVVENIMKHAAYCRANVGKRR
jgi:pSer/pThr/pTyr-binding forkhead associated (FHA) protein